MNDLIDIEGLDYISWWPLAIGWWLLLGFVLILVAVGVFFALKKYKYRKSWQYQAHRRLYSLQKQLSQADPKQVLQTLSLEIRKIAMLRTKRDECAGLAGSQWLQWLQTHDPAGFNWLENGTALINAQYMPDALIADKEHVLQLINAAKGWVQKC